MLSQMSDMLFSGIKKKRLKKNLQLGSMCTWAESKCKGTELGTITIFSGATHVNACHDILTPLV